jgi:hypothetical protein
MVIRIPGPCGNHPGYPRQSAIDRQVRYAESDESDGLIATAANHPNGVIPKDPVLEKLRQVDLSGLGPEQAIGLVKRLRELTG